MSRESFTRRRWLALVAGGVTAGCGGRQGSTRTPTDTATATRTETTVDPTREPTRAGTAEPTPVPAGSFERGTGECLADGQAIPDGTWPMVGHDPARTNRAPGLNGPQTFPLNRRWTVSAVDSSISLPVADGDALYLVAAHDDTTSRADTPSTVVLSHDPRRNGEVRWRHRTPRPPIGPPTVAGDAVYVPLGPPEDSRVQVLSSADGTPRATHRLPSRFEGVVSAVGDHLLVPAEGGYVVTDGRSGEHCWTFSPNGADATATQGRHVRAGAADGGVAYVGTGYPDATPTDDVGHLFAVDPRVGGARWDATLDGPVSGVAVADETVVVATGGRLVALDTETGRRRWQTPVGNRVRPATLALTDDLAIYGTRRTLSAVALADGTERWRRRFGVRGDVIVVGDLLFAVGRIDPTTQRIQILTLHVGSGRERWRQDIYDPVVGVTAAHGHLYTITADGRMFAFSSTG